MAVVSSGGAGGVHCGEERVYGSVCSASRLVCQTPQGNILGVAGHAVDWKTRLGHPLP